MAHIATDTNDDCTRRLFGVSDGDAVVFVWAKGPRDAEHTCYVHSYLDDSVTKWEVSEVMTDDCDRIAAVREADRRFDALHGRVA